MARTGLPRPAIQRPLARWGWNRAATAASFSFRGLPPHHRVGGGVQTPVNRQPTSPAAGHSVQKARPFSTTENRIQLSVRTKLAQGCSSGAPPHMDSVVGCSRSSRTGSCSRPNLAPLPFHRPRARKSCTCTPPPPSCPLAGAGRFSGVGLVHQSNGQTTLSRSWNQVYR